MYYIIGLLKVRKHIIEPRSLSVERLKQKVLFIDAFLFVYKGWGCVVSVLTSSRNRVGFQCWEVGSCECEITLCSPRDTHNATNKKMNDPV